MKRIAWVTPFTKKSSIARETLRIANELKKYHNIDIFTDSKNDLFSTDLKVTVFSNADDVSLDGYDYIIYMMGNFAGYHRGCYELLKKYGGIVIQHDQTMSGFFRQYFLFEDFGGNHITGIEPYRRLVTKHYGTDGEIIFNEELAKNIFPIYEQGKMQELDFLPEIFSHANAVFTHAHFFLDRISKYSNIPTSYSILSLPESYSDIDKSKADIIFSLFKRDKNKLLIVASGIVHPVKRVHKVIDVILSNDFLKDNIQFLVVGSYGGEYGNRLLDLSKKELKNSLFMLGYQSDDVMRSAIYNADICINLRYPNSEVCSLSVLEQMAFGKPCIVLDSGFFGELPDNAVLRTNLNNETEDISSFLTNAINDRDFYKAVGENAKRFVQSECNVEKYVDRFNMFLSNVDRDINVANIENSVIDSYRNILVKLNFEDKKLHGVYNDIAKNLLLTFGEDVKVNSKKRLALWFGFQHEIPSLKREGITRFAVYLAKAFIEYYDIDIEVWYYSFNDVFVKESFEMILNDKNMENKITLYHEKLFDDMGINSCDDNLYLLAKKYSKSDVIMPVILYLDNVCGVDKKIVVPAHDMAVSKHYLDFIECDRLYKARAEDIVARANNLARNGAFMFTITNFVRHDQVLKYVTALNEDKSTFVYIPATISKNIKSDFSEYDFKNKYGIKARYIFYPTQIRPYKNVQLILKALLLLDDRYDDLTVVLTGELNDCSEVSWLVENSKIKDRVILATNISDEELSLFYKFSSLVICPSYFEGGFPLQGQEALYFDIPVAMADIPVTKERIESVGLTYDTAGIEIFNPKDEESLAKSIKNILNDRVSAVEKQRKLKDKLLAYSWNDAIKQYYEVFFESD